MTPTPWRGQSSGTQPLSRGCPLVSPPQPGGHNEAQWLQVLQFSCSPPGLHCCPRPQPGMGGHGWTLIQPWVWGTGPPSNPGTGGQDPHPTLGLGGRIPIQEIERQNPHPTLGPPSHQGTEGQDSCSVLRLGAVRGVHPHASTCGCDVGTPRPWPLSLCSPRDPLPGGQVSHSRWETESRQAPGSAPGREPTAGTPRGPAVPARASPSSGLLSQPCRWSPSWGEGLWVWDGRCWQKVPLSLGGAPGRANSD